MGLSLKSLATGGLYDVFGGINKGLKAGEAGYGQAMGTINDAYGRAGEAIRPYQDYGVETLADLRRFTGMADPYAAVEADPSYKAGLGAVTNSAAARNRLLSGRHMKDLLDYGASSYDRILGRKMGLADWGFNTGAGQGVNLAVGQGNALAGLQVGQGQAKADRYKGWLELAGGLGGTLLGRK